MIKLLPYNNNYRNNFSFGKAVEIDQKSLEQQLHAKKFEEFAQLASESAPSTSKSFLVVSALMSASALTGAAVSGRFFNLLNGLGCLKKFTPKIPVGIEFLQSKLKNVNLVSASKFKKFMVKTSDSLLTSLENLSKSGVEDELSKINAKKAKRIQTIGKKIKKANPDVNYTKKDLAEAVKEHIAKNLNQKEYFDNLTTIANDFKGANLAKKVTKSTAATVMGVGALKEASKDVDNNGVPDCVEFGSAKKESTQKLTAALIDCALDSI